LIWFAWRFNADVVSLKHIVKLNTAST